MRLTIHPVRELQGRIAVPGDKSISHRAVMIGALARGKTEIEGFLKGEDCLSTVSCIRALGIPVEIKEDLVVVEGQGLHGLQEPEDVLHVGNSGTTIRLLSGILAGQNFTTILTGDASIRRRPMGRVTGPLKKMGASIAGRQEGTLAPLAIGGGRLTPITYLSPVASAQVKSALLLAGLYTDGWTEIQEPSQSRNHSELMLGAFGAHIEAEGNRVRIKGQPVLTGRKVVVPGDISSAAFFMVAGLVVPRARIIIERVGLNPTRDGLVEVLQEMGGRVEIRDTRIVAGETIGTVLVESSDLRGVKVGGAIIPRLIDEIPVLAVAALFARGVTEIRDAEELKVKESNRISAMAQGLTALGARVEELPDGLRIYGGYPLRGTALNSFQDHRIAMALAVAALRAEGETRIEGAEAVDISFPQFAELLAGLKRGEA